MKILQGLNMSLTGKKHFQHFMYDLEFSAVYCSLPALPLLHSYASMIVLLFCCNHFIDVYCHMLIAALEFMLCRSRE
jgi:hypothetical protein